MGDIACDDCEEEMLIAPLELEDLSFNSDYDQVKNRHEVIADKKKPTQLRNFNQPLVTKWRMASKAALHCRDPWEEYKISELYREEECIRHRYSAYRQQWVTDRVFVKTESEPFGRGAMRECFRLKKLSAPSQSQHSMEQWAKALNYVAKRYLTEVDRKTYFSDVQLQADAKLWSEEFNRHNPPKKIDIMQVSILEFPNRPNRPLYHLEHFIEGEYIKYNSNSGFVSDQARQTPQAFSHFTFERSGHQLIVVDIQGVGDLYTDPQIHSADGKSFYGDGDLGTKGMALFFHSHDCNSICQSMALTPFDLSPTERAAMKRGHIRTASESKTFCRRGSVELCQSPSFGSSARVMNYLRQRSLSKSDCIEDHTSPTWPLDENDNKDLGFDSSDEGKINHKSDHYSSSPPPIENVSARRFRYSSSTETGYGSGYSTSIELESDQWKEKMDKLRKPSCIPSANGGIMYRDEGALILGMIHMDLVRYYEIGRFSVTNDAENQEFCNQIHPSDLRAYDKASAWFHLEAAGRCGILDAITTMAKIYLGLPHDLLRDFSIEAKDQDLDDDEDSTSDLDRGMDLMEEAAYMGDRSSMLFMAESYETGRNLGSERQISWSKAIEWYEKAINFVDTDSDTTDEVPRYKILAKMAEIYHKGGPQLSSDLAKAGELYSSAAEAATEAMQGKLASRLYMLAEEAWASVEEE